ncbi:hypothetical protein [Maritimibacter sp. DP1N21-5]|uniref:hypothetical protein n=1 Tax=Maritimibacter sp. DP1N21-5 TaxID=2836867 RepID=UPI001C47AA7C|nr:hypothetical protein [Maritimibacter sp. DP1N21-5]MBV7408223.1 hypothetical protein [Maritimibacter sp. DP1N21-5]
MAASDQDIVTLRLTLLDVTDAKERAGIAVLLSRSLRAHGLFPEARQVLETEYAAGSRAPHLLRTLGLERFRQGDIAGGLTLYDRGRWQLDSFQGSRRPFAAPFWSGEPIAGKRLLVWGEQGLGDQVMQARLLRQLVDAGAQVTAEVDHRLLGYLALRNDIDAFPQLEKPPPALSSRRFDYQTSMLSGWRFVARPLSHARTLTPDQARVASYRSLWSRMGQARNVGLSWHSQATGTGADRSLDLSLLTPLARREGVRFHSLQYGDVDPQTASRRLGAPILVDPKSNPLKDLTHQLAQIAALDLVITIDNATAHLAGALGVPCWVILPKASDWRWGTAEHPNRLYDSLRLFRSGDSGQWSSALLPLFAAFEDWCRAGSASSYEDPRIASIRFARGLAPPGKRAGS